MSRWITFAVVAFSFVAGCRSGTTRPSSSMAEGDIVDVAPPPSAADAAKQDYGAERCRLVNERDEIVSILKNGATVIVRRVPSPVVAVRGYVNTGGVYEGKWLGGGLSHLLEHLVAGGSNQRRTEAHNRDLLQEIGNNSNAYTSEDHTAFFINTTAEHMEPAVDLVTGWMLGALITPEEYRREYQVVQRELEKDKGEPDWVFYELATINRYHVSPARVPVIGYQEVIQGLSRDDVYSYYKLAYQPNDMIFSVAGNLDPEVMLKAVQKNVADAKPGREFSRDVADEPPVLAPRTLVATFPKLGQAKLNIAFPTVKLSDPDLYALDLLSTALAGGESALLVEDLRDKQQLVNSIAASSNTPSYVEGDFDFSMDLDPKNIAPATTALLEQIAHLKANGIDADRLARAKTQMRTQRVKSMQTSEDIASSLASDYMSTADPHFSDRYVERIEKVTAEQVQAAAQKYFVAGRLITTALLPSEYVGAKGLPAAEDLIRPVAPTTQPGGEKTVAQAPKVERMQLENGTVVLLKRNATTPLVQIRMYAHGGVTAEDAASNGIGNLAMEMLPRGTDSRKAADIAEFFDSTGGSIDTACGNNSWYWNAECMKADFAKTMEVFGDIVAHPSFPDGELAPMKQRILAAIESEDSQWDSQAMHYFMKEYFGPRKSPYQFLRTGMKENVKKLTADQLRQWYQQKVLAATRVIAIYGDIDADQAKKLAADQFGKLPKAAIPAASPALHGEASIPEDFVRGTPAIEVQRVAVQKTEQPLAGIVIGFNSSSVVGDPANFPIDVADTMCSGYDYPTGYLFETLRGRGYVYEVAAQSWPGRSPSIPGTFYVIAGCDASKVNEVIDIILQNIARLQGKPADMQESWFARSKQLITTAEALNNETPASQATSAALDELYGLGFDYHDRFADKINAVTLPQVQITAARRLRQCVVTVSTPDPDSVNVQTGRREYNSFPTVDLTPRGIQHDTPGGAGK